MRLLATIVTVLAVGCAGETAGDPAAVPSRTSATSTSTSTTSTSTLEEPTAAWQPGSFEPAAEVKVAAVRAVEAVGNFADGDGSIEAARRRLSAGRLEPRFADSAALALLGVGQGRATIVYPELAGLTATEAAVMVVVDIRPGTGADDAIVRRTLDVRLAKRAGAWVATALASEGGSPPEVSRPSEAARVLLALDRIDLPDSARWDLEAGLVDDRVVRLLDDWSAKWKLSVTVFASGHPMNVFATDRISNHARGRAVDVWAVEDQPVAAQQTASVLRTLVQLALDAGATEIGAPFDADGSGGRVFTNVVHQDHLHIGFDV